MALEFVSCNLNVLATCSKTLSLNSNQKFIRFYPIVDVIKQTSRIGHLKSNKQFLFKIALFAHFSAVKTLKKYFVQFLSFGEI